MSLLRNIVWLIVVCWVDTWKGPAIPKRRNGYLAIEQGILKLWTSSLKISGSGVLAFACNQMSVITNFSFLAGLLVSGLLVAGPDMFEREGIEPVPQF